MIVTILNNASAFKNSFNITVTIHRAINEYPNLTVCLTIYVTCHVIENDVYVLFNVCLLQGYLMTRTWPTNRLNINDF
jgi:hypothetical protein